MDPECHIAGERMSDLRGASSVGLERIRREPPTSYSPVTSTRDAILDAALDLALEVGFRRTTVAEVARRAGVSRMTAYRYFTDNATLINAVQTREFSVLLAAITSTVERTCPNGAERSAALLSAAAREISIHPVMRMTRELDPSVLLTYLIERLGSTQRIALAAIEASLQGAVDDGSATLTDVRATATMLMLTAQSVIISYEALEREGLAQRALTELDRMVHATLGLR